MFSPAPPFMLWKGTSPELPSKTDGVHVQLSFCLWILRNFPCDSPWAGVVSIVGSLGPGTDECFSVEQVGPCVTTQAEMARQNFSAHLSIKLFVRHGSDLLWKLSERSSSYLCVNSWEATDAK